MQLASRDSSEAKPQRLLLRGDVNMQPEGLWYCEFTSVWPSFCFFLPNGSSQRSRQCDPKIKGPALLWCTVCKKLRRGSFGGSCWVTFWISGRKVSGVARRVAFLDEGSLAKALYSKLYIQPLQWLTLLGGAAKEQNQLQQYIYSWVWTWMKVWIKIHILCSTRTVQQCLVQNNVKAGEPSDSREEAQAQALSRRCLRAPRARGDYVSHSVYWVAQLFLICTTTGELLHSNAENLIWLMCSVAESQCELKV